MSSKDKVRGISENVLIFSLIFSSKKNHHPIKFQFSIIMRRERAITKQEHESKFEDIKIMPKIMCLNALQIFQSLKLVRLAKNAIAISTNCLFAKEERRKNVRELHNPGEIVLKRLHRTQEMGLLLPLRPLSF